MEIKFEKLDFNNSDPYYVQITDIIEQKILNKEIPVGKKLPPEEELRKVFNVSLDTMREAMAKLIEDGYIRRRPSIGTIVISSEPPQRIDLKRKNEICFVICTGAFRETSGDPSFNELIKGVEKEASQNGLNLLVKAINEDTEEMGFNGKAKDIAGLIIAGNITPKNIKVIKKAQIPFALIGDVFQKTKTDGKFDVITNDDFQGTYMATRHLIDSGYGRIVYFARPVDSFPWTDESFRGYKKALEDASIAYDKDLFVEVNGPEFEDGYNVMKEFIEKSIPFNGLVGYLCNREFYGAAKAFSDKNIRIPDDVSVVLYSDLNGMPFVDNNMMEKSRTAVKRLIQRLTGPDWKPERVIIPYKLNIRKSAKPLEEVHSKLVRSS